MRALRPVLAALLLSLALPAAAGAVPRTYVSGVGDDNNTNDNCTVALPCKTWAGAISKTDAGGTITALDSAGYGAVTVTKSITLDGAGFLSSALASGSNGIIVNGAGIDVTLKRLNVDGAGICTPSPGLNGIRFLLGHALTLEDVGVQGFPGSGLSVTPTDGHGTIVARDSLFANNCTAGVSAAATSGDTTVRLEDDLITGNTTGVSAGAFSALTLTGNTIARNTTNTATVGGGTLTSQGDNRIDGVAGTLGAFPTPPAPVVPAPAPVVPAPAPAPAAPVVPPVVKQPAVRCKVPKLTGLTLAGAKKALEHAHCRLGAVSYTTKKGAKRNRVFRQGLKAGSVRVAKTKVSLSINGKAPHKAKARAAAVIGAATRTWVSAVGSDANPCSRTAPCRTFASAITKVAQNGIVDVVGNGDYGPVTIDHSLTIDGLGADASISVGSGSAITVAAGAGEKVTIKNLDLSTTTRCSAAGSGDGITLQSGGALLVDNVTADGFPGAGVAVAPGANGSALIRGGSLTRNCTAGISAQHATVVADGVLATGNGAGIAAGPGGLVQLGHSSIINNATGFAVTGDSQVQAWPDTALSPNGGAPGFTPGTLPLS